MKHKQIVCRRLVGKRFDEFVAVDEFFNHPDAFRGCTGSHFVAVPKDSYDYLTSQEGAEEHLQDAWDTMCGDSEDYEFRYGPKLEDLRGYTTRQRELDRAERVYDRLSADEIREETPVAQQALTRLDNARDKMNELKEQRKELAFKDFVRQTLNVDGDEAIFDLSYCCNGIWEQIRERFPDTMGEEQVPIFECTGGGRCFRLDEDKWEEVYDPHLLDWVQWWERGGFRQYTTGILGELAKTA